MVGTSCDCVTLCFSTSSQEFFRVEVFHDDGGAAERDRHHVEAQGSGVIERRRRQIDAVGIHPAHVGAENFQERIRQLDRMVIRRPLDALGTAGGARRIQHVVAGFLVRDRRRRLRCGFPVPGAEAGQWLVEHEEQRLAGRAGDQPLDLLGAFRRGDDDFGAAIPDDVGDLVLGQIAADRGVIQPRALRRPADLHECQPVLHQEGDVIAGLQAERTKQMRALVRQLVEFTIGDRLAGRGHLIGDLVGLGACMHRRMGHWGFLWTQIADASANGGQQVANRGRTLVRIRSLPATRRSLLFYCSYSRSTMVTLAMPPPSHMVCNP